jgi:4-diphosphocytidyl-2-C-methyl-D-erythritol kinase
VSETLQAVTVRVPAKINIQLSVGPLRPDGFHELQTVFHAVGLFDVITAEPADRLSLSLSGPESAGLAADGSNLAWRAAELLAGHAGVAAGVALHIDKSIPIAAGLAGGSADAAGTLLACARLWGVSATVDDLAGLAARLGSDVPFGLHGRTAVGTGRGEHLQPVEHVGAFHWVIAAADAGLSTPAVYRELDRQREAGRALPPAPPNPAVLAALAGGDPVQLAPHLSNDLEPAAIALAPALGATLATGRQLGALAAIVSGSGPTCVFLATDDDHANRLAVSLAASGRCRFAVAVAGGVASPEVVG